MLCSACICVGVHRINASTSLILRLSLRSVALCAMPYLSATSLVLSYSRPITEITFTSAMFLIASRCLIPNAPAPTSATWIVMSVLQDQVSDGRVRRRHMVEAVRHLGRRTTGEVGHRTARDQPHHQLDALAAGLAHVLDVWHLRQAGRVIDQTVEEAVVPLLVDQAGTRPLQLVAHATGAPDLHVERPVVRLDRLPNGLAEHEAAASG